MSILFRYPRNTSRRREQGMVFSVEPGAYLPGKWGIGIEDIVAVSPAGECRCLTGLDHGLIVR